MTTLAITPFDDGDLEAVYNLIKARFTDAADALNAAKAMVSVASNHLLQRVVDEKFFEQATWEAEYLVEDKGVLVYLGNSLRDAKTYWLSYPSAKLSKHLISGTEWVEMTSEELHD